MTKRFILSAATLAALAGLTLFARPAQAQTFTLQFLGTGAGQNVSVVENGSTINTFAGLLSFSATASGVSYGSFGTMCVDLDHHVAQNDTYTVSLAPTLGPKNGGINNGGQIGYLFNTYAGTGLDNDHAAGLQVAIWELLKDNDRNLATGVFQFTTAGNVLNDANAYLTSAANQSYNGLWADASLNGAVFNHKQSQMVFGSGVGVQDTPEPGTVSLLCSIPTVGLAILRRHRKRR